MTEPNIVKRCEHGLIVHMHHGAIPDDDVLGGLIEAGLRVIAKQCEKYNRNWPEKYGTNYENDVFLMRQECWCDKNDCRYCDADTNGGNEPPYFYHKKSSLSVWWYKYIGRSMQIKGPSDAEEILNILLECYKSI